MIDSWTHQLAVVLHARRDDWRRVAAYCMAANGVPKTGVPLGDADAMRAWWRR